MLVRGYGEVVPPQWTAISGLLGMMDIRYQLKPSTGEAAGHIFQGLQVRIDQVRQVLLIEGLLTAATSLISQG